MSHFATCRLAAGETVPSTSDSLHLASCAACRAQLLQAQRARHTRRGRSLPPALPRAARGPAPRGWVQASVTLMAFAAALSVLVLHAAEPSQAAPQRSVITGEIHKANGELVHLAPLDALAGMGDGDRLSVRVRVTEPMRAILSAQDNGVPRIYFDAVVPPAGLLPVAVIGSDSVPPHLRLELCPLSQADTKCDTFDLQ